MPNRQELPPLSLVSSQKRIEQMNTVWGVTVTTRILSLALYFLGASLKELALFVGLPIDTIKALVKRTLRDGLPALEDRRSKASTFLPTMVETPGPLSCKLIFRDDVIWVALGDEAKIRLLRRNTAQCKIVLLTLLDAKLLSFAQVAQALGLSEERTRKLRTALIEEDVNAVLDKRRGQQREYLVTPEVKSELIQQFVVNALSGWPTSGRAIAEELQERCEIEVSERSVRLYLNKLGLSGIKETLPMLLESQKKRSSNS